jgi:hypothetical protein
MVFRYTDVRESVTEKCARSAMKTTYGQFHTAALHEESTGIENSTREPPLTLLMAIRFQLRYILPSFSTLGFRIVSFKD